MASRVARAMVRRAAEGDLEAVSALRSMQAAVDEALGQAAAAAHDFGYSWTHIADELGISRQAAWQQYGKAVAS